MAGGGIPCPPLPSHRRHGRETAGIGSAAYHRPGDPTDIVYTLSDRGPNFARGEAEAITGTPRAALCAEAPQGRVYPVLDYAPTIYGVPLLPAEGRFRVFEGIALKGRDGRPLSGLTNPLPGRAVPPLDGAGRRLDFDASAVDAEGLVRLPDGATLYAVVRNPLANPDAATY